MEDHGLFFESGDCGGPVPADVGIELVQSDRVAVLECEARDGTVFVIAQFDAPDAERAAVDVQLQSPAGGAQRRRCEAPAFIREFGGEETIP